MKRFIVALTLVCMGALAGMAFAGDYHTTTTLICSDCHNMHSSMTHSYGNAAQKDVVSYPWSSTGHEYLLFGDVNETCLLCHDNNNIAPDVYGINTSTGYPGTRLGGGLNGALAGHPAPGGSYSDNTGHTLGSMDAPPGTGGLYVPATEGLECTSCHAQHGSTTQYRNLLNRGIFGSPNPPKTLNYEIAPTKTNTKDVYERIATNFDPNHYSYTNVDYEEPYADSSRYANWCKTCHTSFHGAPGGAQLGGSYGGYNNSSTSPWLRHPTNGVNLLSSTPTFVASLSTYAGRTNKVHMMDSQGLWTGAAADSTLTPSCMSCHKAHGNENPFGLIYMSGTGTITDNGDGGTYKSLCKQCHVQG